MLVVEHRKRNIDDLEGACTRHNIRHRWHRGDVEKGKCSAMINGRDLCRES